MIQNTHVHNAAGPDLLYQTTSDAVDLKNLIPTAAPTYLISIVVRGSSEMRR